MLAPGAQAYLDGVVKVNVVRDLGDGRIIVSIGQDTQVVEAANLTVDEF